jgi:hypothetical protein
MPFEISNDAPKVTVGGSSASASQTSTQYQKYVEYTQSGEEGHFSLAS